jgi:hypothetical protein
LFPRSAGGLGAAGGLRQLFRSMTKR